MSQKHSRTGKVILSDYYSLDWLQKNIELCDLPITINNQGLYQQMLASLLPYPIREQETLAELLHRITQVHQHEKKQITKQLYELKL